MSQETPVYKFTLRSKKVIYLREPRMSDSESAIQVAGMKAKDNMALLGLLTQKELFKKLLVQVDDRVLKMAEKENLEGLFSFKEWADCSKALAMVAGDDDEGNLEAPEITTIGSK